MQPFTHVADNPPCAASSDTDETFACFGSDDHADNHGTDVLILGRNRDTPQRDPVEVVHRPVKGSADSRSKRSLPSAHQPIAGRSPRSARTEDARALSIDVTTSVGSTWTPPTTHPDAR